jgi:ribosomal protein S12 methylthiotransferase
VKDNSIKIITLGCSKNIVDSEKLLKQVQAGGYDILPDEGDCQCSTVIINTCGFIIDAKEESIDTILQSVRAMKAGKIGRLYVMGCLVQRYMKELRTEIPEVTRFFGVNNQEDILNELGILNREEKSTGRIITTPGHYAYLKVSEGCNRSCAFCVIPSIRGRYVSRPLESILSEAEELAASGTRELILVAQDMSYYGLDLYKTPKLHDLLNLLLEIKSFEWIRLQYLYPSPLPEKLIALIRDNPVICKYIDMPIQHVSDKMLSMMKRSCSRSQTESILNRLRVEIPGAAIRTTLIVGHPGETDEDYRELREFVKKFRFNRLGIFAYSAEEGTYSYNNYKNDVPDKIKASRLSELMEIQQAISADNNEKLVGTTLKVIIDRREGDYFIGRTEFDSPEIDQEVLIPVAGDIHAGNFYQVEITGSTDFDLFARQIKTGR